MNKTIKVSIAVALAIAASTLVLALPHQSTNACAATNAVKAVIRLIVPAVFSQQCI